MITFTSGSSGLPKGVNRTHGFLAAQHAALQHEFPQQDDDIDMPMFPVFALNNMGRGVPSIIPFIEFRHVERTDGSVIARQMHQNGVTTCTASPPFLDQLANYLQHHPAPAVHLRRILTGGAPVSDNQIRHWRCVWPDAELVVVYGSTEAEPVAHINADVRLSLRPMPPRKATGYCIGKAGDLVQLRIVRIYHGPIPLARDGWSAWELPREEVGEIVVTGKHVAKSYFKNAEADADNKMLDTDGTVWHRMGDTGYIDEAGYVWLVGRIHSTIHRQGQAVHPQLVEQAGAANGPNLRIAAIGLPDAELGERVVVIVETNSAEILPQVRQRILEAGLPVDELRRAERPLPLDPRHRSKIDYPALRKQLLRP
jgi:acyl-CoA synthetase (AMP-forming)/AMP-acid ligase II